MIVWIWNISIRISVTNTTIIWVTRPCHGLTRRTWLEDIGGSGGGFWLFARLNRSIMHLDQSIMVGVMVDVSWMYCMQSIISLG